jgi:hypothetical protein
MKLELLIPTSLSEIPLKHYQEFRKVAENSNDEEFVAEKMIELFCGIELKDVIKIKASDISDMVSHFNKLFSGKQKFEHRFKIGDLEFGFVPDLENISWGEYIDIERNLTDWDTMHKAMAAMYRPITKRKGEKYEIEEYNGTANYSEVMKYAPLNVVFGASVFFWTLGSELLTALMDYLEKEMKGMDLTTIQSNLNLENNGVGIKAYMHSLKETLQDLTQLPENHWLSV